MTYNGREITEEQITLEMIRDIVLTQFLTPRLCSTRNYWYYTRGFKDKDKIFNYQAVLEEYLNYIHRHNSKPPEELEFGVLKVLEKWNSSTFSYELEQYKEERTRKWAEEQKRLREEARSNKKQTDNFPQQNSEKSDFSQTSTGVVELPLTNNRQNYQEQLEDLRWTVFRAFVFVVKGQRCEKCGSTHCLNLHHIKYVPGRKAWEYTCNEVQVLCKECHAKEHGIADAS